MLISTLFSLSADLSLVDIRLEHEGLTLVPLDSERTRRISRWRIVSQPSLWNTLSDIFVEPFEFLMTRRMLLRIKQRAEKTGELAAKPAEAEKKPGPNGRVTSTMAMQL
jgi:hypothetical protein